jgi:hypothetical protein
LVIYFPQLIIYFILCSSPIHFVMGLAHFVRPVGLAQLNTKAAHISNH